MPASTYTLRPWDQTSPHLDGILALARRVWPQEGEPSLLRHITYPGFLGRLALDAQGHLAGYVYGTTALAGQWWTEKIAEVLGPEAAARELVGSFAVTELAVAPEVRRQRIGEALMRVVLAAAAADHLAATLSTECANAPARALYERLGFGYLVPRMRFSPEGEEYVVMRRSLPLA